MTIDLNGKVALVTGAGRGIGEGCARALASAGALVWVNDLDSARAEAVASQVNGRPAPGDVTQAEQWLKPITASGPLHILVHNAGYDIETKIGESKEEDFRRILAVQVTGPAMITQQLLPSLKAAEGAVVIHIGSVHARATEKAMSAYAAAKGGVVAMVNSMAQDLGPHRIRVLAVSPGFVHTHLIDLWASSTPDPAATMQMARDLHPLGRIGTPADIGALVTFLSSSYAEFINGTNVVIDGGLSTRLF